MGTLLLVGLAGVRTDRAAGQTVLVQVLGAETAEPLLGAIAHLVVPDGDVVGSRLTDRNGRALFAGIDAGRYLVRAEMIGRTTGESDAFRVVAGGSVPLVVRLQPRAIALAGVEVTAEAGPCQTRPREEGRLLAAVWDEARKALSATAVTDQQGVYRYALLHYVRVLDEDQTILDEQQRRREGYMRTPFESRPVEDLTESGFVERGVAEWVYYAPDAQVLLDDNFLDTHCFRLVNGPPEEPGLVGLSFEPSGEIDVPDIAGTLWLDRESVELRWLDYSYENLEPEVRSGEAVGRVEFQRLPAGAWIVPEWWILSPVIEVGLGGVERRRRVTGFRQTGGRVLEIREAGGRDLGRGVSTGAIEGIVVDSLGVPMPGIRVGVVGSNQAVFTNAEGRFNVVGLGEGTYGVRFVRPDLAAVGLTLPTVSRAVLAGESSYLEYHMPTLPEVLLEACGDEARAGTGVLAGVVRDESTDAPIPGAVVSVVWSSLTLGGVGGTVFGREQFDGLETTSSESGFYSFCALPRREELTIVSTVDGDESEETTLALSSEEVGRVHVIRHRR